MTLGGPKRRPGPEGLIPLPFYPWISRPESVRLDVEEARTAIFLANGDINAAAALLKVTTARLKRTIRRYPDLQRLRADLAGSVLDSAP